MSGQTETRQKYIFKYNSFLNIHEPVVLEPFTAWSERDWSKFNAEASKIAAEIPYKIKELDRDYMAKHERLDEDEDRFYELMGELNEISEKICALNVLFLHIEGRYIQTDIPN